MSGPPELDPALDEAIRRASAAGWEDESMSEHPGTEELVAYQEKRLASSERRRIRAHLALCPSCAREVMDLESFEPEPASSPAPALSAVEMGEDWAAFERRLELSQEGSGPEKLVMPPPDSQSLRSLQPSWGALAASIVVALGGLAFWVAGVAERGEVPSSAARHGAAPLFLDLLPEGQQIRGAPGIPDPRGAGEADSLVLRLNLGDASHESYRAVLLDASGQRLWTWEDLPRQGDGTFVVLVGRELLLSSGRHSVKLSGTKGAEEAALATYSFLSPGFAP